MTDLVRAGNGGWTHPGDPGEPGCLRPRVGVSPRESALLAELFRGALVLEIGTGIGCSTRAIAESASRVWTVDIDPWVQETIWPGLPGNVTTVADPEAIGFDRFDAAFIDGKHDAASVAADAALCAGLVRSGGLLVFHDIRSDEVFAGASSVVSPIHRIETEYGIGLWVKP